VKSLSTQRPVCSCGQPFTIVDGLCADCWTAKTGDTPRQQCCGRPMQPWPHDRCMCVQPAKHIRCEGCGIPSPEPGENPDPAFRVGVEQQLEAAGEELMVVDEDDGEHAVVDRRGHGAGDGAAAGTLSRRPVWPARAAA